MKITLKLFASLAVHLPAGARPSQRIDLDVNPGTTVLDVIRRHYTVLLRFQGALVCAIDIRVIGCKFCSLPSKWIQNDHRVQIVLSFPSSAN